ncbi:hypothetical protein HQ587_05105 [bacterium]|nr:hypothetical protein [bacterium]
MARTKINLSTQVEDQLSPSNLAQDASNRLVTDAEKSGWSAKAETTTSTPSTDGLMSAADKSKLNGIEASANNYSHPATHSLDIITETTTKKILTDTERSKLSGIEANANDYSHPVSHPSTMITEDTSHRFVTDTEKSIWNDKAETDVATGAADGLMSASDKDKLDGIEASANNYSHPADHPATMITEDASHRFVSDTEKSTWNDKLDKAGGTVTGDLTVSGNLDVNGTTTSIDTVNLEIEDNVVLLNSNQTGTPPTTLRSGIEVERGDADNVKIQYNELTDKWEITEDGTTFHDIAKEDDARFLTSAQKTAATRDATGSQNGLMTATQASKLNGIEASANNYSLPTASGSTKGGVKVGSSLNISSEVLDVPSSTTSQKGVIKYPQTETFSGDGMTTDFVLTNTPGDYLAVYLGGLRQTPTDDYTVSNKTISFLTAPLSGQKIVVDYIEV